MIPGFSSLVCLAAATIFVLAFLFKFVAAIQFFIIIFLIVLNGRILDSSLIYGEIKDFIVIVFLWPLRRLHCLHVLLKLLQHKLLQLLLLFPLPLLQLLLRLSVVLLHLLELVGFGKHGCNLSQLALSGPFVSLSDSL